MHPHAPHHRRRRPAGTTSPGGHPGPRPARRRAAGAAAGLVVLLAAGGALPASAWADDDTHRVRVEVAGDGSAGLVDGDGTYRAGDTVRLTALPASEATTWGGWTSEELGWIGARVHEFTMPDGDVHLATSFRDRAPALTEAYRDHFDVGAIWGPQSYADPRSSAVIARDYGVMTAENAMKPEALLPDRNIADDGTVTFDWSTADAFVEQTRARGMRVHGHVLVWHSQSPPRLNSGTTGGTRELARRNMERYIQEVLTRYSGLIPTWDVVNEAFIDSVAAFDPATDDWQDFLRGGPRGGTSSWYRVYAEGADASAGESAGDFVYDAFVLARQHGPEVSLQYNDFNLFESSGKARAVVAMASELNARYAQEHPEDDRLLIEVIGMQSHDYINQTPALACTGSRVPDLVDPVAEEWQSGACSDRQSLEASIRLFRDAGLEVAISELDLQVFEAWDAMPQGVNNNDLADYVDLTDPSAKDLFHREGATYWVGKITNRAELEAIQAQRYAEFFQVFSAYSEGIERVTFWGLTDADSWRRNHNPLTLNRDYSEKLAAWAVADPVGWLTRDEAPAPSPEPTPFAGTVSTARVAPGGEVRVDGRGATPGGVVRAELHSEVEVLGSVDAGPDGAYALTVRIPGHVLPGAHTLVVVDEATGARWAVPITVTDPARVPGGGPDDPAGGTAGGTGGGAGGGAAEPAGWPEALAVTGAGAAALVLVATVLLAAGGATLVVSRRRRA
ncbi:endo-1,4-beta-xylanase [Cellulomonas hominis]|uniref:Endo-1,4-beta-xylanase n=1 Tax=Cellulomonas hominis TaxID=156981 RepID=A0A7Z8JXV8_9CELL|nr:endo-1,4-beta-xylanase [Cellulomonas hominis]TKR22346.1 endo-1,4-beta-xylanase [Cellulomonas hominis]